ncbi:putative expansin-B2 [Amaranthus tricolor]|uniref:putative expansin-B2 n=1 Tax=Amaranthus tricolor TaxID=29722 RepID=UPI00258D8657|nr:putative expansin-B2 [Amaranthus tricolor]
MALSPSHLIHFTIIFAFLVSISHGFNPKSLNVSRIYQRLSNSNWSPASATWYGSPNGAGSNGGACGFTDTVEKAPYSSMVSAAGNSIYSYGEGCGVCYQVKCTESTACSGKPVTVTITDQCPGCPSAHFDLSGTAFGAMAKPGQSEQLRDVGKLGILYKRVKCKYPGVTVEVRVDPGSNQNYFASTIEYTDGTGIESVKLKQRNGGWKNMEKSWGAVWEYNGGTVLQPPFSLQLTEIGTGATLTLNNVIPGNWNPGQTYRSQVNFNN